MAPQQPSSPAEILKQGVLACRADKWREGLELLTQVAQGIERKGNLPGLYYSYLGVAIARCQGRKHDGMKLCRYAVKRQPKEPDNYCNLATVYMMVGRRKAAVRALRKGLAISPDHERLRELHDTLGVRKSPPLPFLHRSSPPNVWIGRVRHRLDEARRRRREEREEALEE